MQLKKLLENVKVLDTNADLDQEINEIRINSHEVGENDLFCCMKGARADGNDYLAQITVPFVAMTETKPEDTLIKYVLVDDAREAYGDLQLGGIPYSECRSSFIVSVFM